MAEPGKVIVACAITGSIHVPSQTPHLPQTPEQIAAEAIAAADAGASDRDVGISAVVAAVTA